MCLLKLQRGALSLIVGVITWHCIMGRHARHFGFGHLANEFCRSCRYEEEEETVPHLLGSCPTLSQTRMKYLGTYYMNDLEELSWIDIVVSSTSV